MFKLFKESRLVYEYLESFRGIDPLRENQEQQNPLSTDTEDGNKREAREGYHRLVVMGTDVNYPQNVKQEAQSARDQFEQFAREAERRQQEIQRQTENTGDEILFGDGMIEFNEKTGEPIVGTPASINEISSSIDGLVDFWNTLSEQERGELMQPLIGMIPLSGTMEAINGETFGSREHLEMWERILNAGVDLGGKPLKILGGPALFAFGMIRIYRGKTKEVAAKTVKNYAVLGKETAVRITGKMPGEATRLIGQSDDYIRAYLELNITEILGKVGPEQLAQQFTQVAKSLHELLQGSNLSNTMLKEIDKYYVEIKHVAERLNDDRVLNQISIMRKTLHSKYKYD